MTNPTSSAQVAAAQAAFVALMDPTNAANIPDPALRLAVYMLQLSNVMNDIIKTLTNINTPTTDQLKVVNSDLDMMNQANANVTANDTNTATDVYDGSDAVSPSTNTQAAVQAVADRLKSEGVQGTLTVKNNPPWQLWMSRNDIASGIDQLKTHADDLTADETKAQTDLETQTRRYTVIFNAFASSAQAYGKNYQSANDAGN